MSTAQFGPFQALFEPGRFEVPLYLELLNWSGRDIQTAIDLIDEALTRNDATNWVDKLLDDANWRPHLVAALALVLDDGGRLDTGALWRAIDAGSWVTPQLVATAYFVDRTFPERVRERMSALCPVVLPAGLSTIARHSATGPSGITGRSAKMMSSLLTLARLIPGLPSDVRQTIESPEFKELLNWDVDRSGHIAAEWAKQLTRHFAVRDRVLRPKCT